MRILIVCILTLFLVGIGIFASINYQINSIYYRCSGIFPSVALSESCWEKIGDQIAKEKGVDRAFKMLPFFSKEKGFGENCHEYLHEVGHYAYTYFWSFKNQQSFQIPAGASSCGYGFYHGLMAGVLSQGVNVIEAKDFCDYLQQKFGDGKKNLLRNCYHGIGHGLEVYKIDWANPKPQIDLAINSCKLIGNGYEDCVTALFGDIGSQYLSQVLSNGSVNINTHTIEEFPDFYKICKLFPEYAVECIPSFDYGVDTQKPLSELLKVTSQLGDTTSKKVAVESISRTYSRKTEESDGSNSNEIDSCSSLNKDLIKPCFLGIIEGKIEKLTTNEKSGLTANFCSRGKVSLKIKNICLDALKETLSSSLE